MQSFECVLQQHLVRTRGILADVTGGGTCRGEAPAITLTHECSPMQTKRSLTKPRSATTCSQIRIQLVALRPGYFAHSAISLNPGGDFVMICSTMGRLGQFSGSR
jgi:hypothetical protein